MSVKKEFKRKMVMIISATYVLFARYILTALTPTGVFWFMALSGMILTFSFPIIDVLVMTILQTVVPLKMQGRVTSVTMSLAHFAQPGGMILAGVITTLTATTNLFLGCAAMGILIAALSWIFTDIKHVEKIEISTNSQ